MNQACLLLTEMISNIMCYFIYVHPRSPRISNNVSVTTTLQGYGEMYKRKWLVHDLSFPLIRLFSLP